MSFAETAVDLGLDPPHFLVGDLKKTARAAGGSKARIGARRSRRFFSLRVEQSPASASLARESSGISTAFMGIALSGHA